MIKKEDIKRLLKESLYDKDVIKAVARAYDMTVEDADRELNKGMYSAAEVKNALAKYKEEQKKSPEVTNYPIEYDYTYETDDVRDHFKGHLTVKAKTEEEAIKKAENYLNGSTYQYKNPNHYNMTNIKIGDQFYKNVDIIEQIQATEDPKKRKELEDYRDQLLDQAEDADDHNNPWKAGNYRAKAEDLDESIVDHYLIEFKDLDDNRVYSEEYEAYTRKEAIDLFRSDYPESDNYKLLKVYKLTDEGWEETYYNFDEASRKDNNMIREDSVYKDYYEHTFSVPYRECISSEEDDQYQYPPHCDHLDQIVSAAVEDFNSADMHKYIPEDMRAISATMEPSEDYLSLVIKIKTLVELDEEQKQDLYDWIEGQMSDGWGEGFEQREVDTYTEQESRTEYDEENDEEYEEVYDIDYYVYGQVWWSDESTKPWDLEVIKYNERNR